MFETKPDIQGRAEIETLVIECNLTPEQRERYARYKAATP